MVSLSRRRRRRGRSLHRFPHGHRLPDCTSALLNQRITVAQQCHSGAGFYGLILGECAGGKAFSRRKFGALSRHLELCQRGGCTSGKATATMISRIITPKCWSTAGIIGPGPKFALAAIRKGPICRELQKNISIRRNFWREQIRLANPAKIPTEKINS